MIYFSLDGLIVRNMEYADAGRIADAEIEQGWDASSEKYLKRLEDQRNGKAIALVAEYSGRPVGYINVYPDNTWGAFGGKGLPEIVDFGVLEKYRRRGIGTILMDIAEKVAARYADTVYLGVGLHSGYGSAQRMYIKRGYLPDGSGVWYKDEICKPYGECKNDDDLVLYFSKKLR
ncbi:MAG: GNAT family N-acetyltransferase [Bacteroides sp.]|nr:GNAT family N-acetyltransferase [Eubacterium sp.]MCM1418884.1 GNAT family N-acetyltransferase [Roseburia sp.]MCM1463373.1 GNAT family N-acetyltransferase [Bacteroides sp.]